MTENERGKGLPVLVVVGARSRAGRAILRAWPGPLIAVHRGADDGRGFAVADYATVPAGAIPAGSVVVNCVGTPNGDAAELDRINRLIPLAWARAARAAGSAGFVQLSSFAVYGRADEVGAATPERPTSDYGRAKLAADRDLLALMDDRFRIVVARIPMLFGNDGADKLGRLVGLLARLGIVPVTRPPIARAMLSYDALAAALIGLVDAPVRGVTLLADPTSFSYELVAERLLRARSLAVCRVTIPGFAAALFGRVAPGIHSRLLASSRVAPDEHFRFDMPPGASLVEEIDRLIARRDRQS